MGADGTGGGELIGVDGTGGGELIGFDGTGGGELVGANGTTTPKTTPETDGTTTPKTTPVKNSSVILISRINPVFSMNFSVSLHSEEEATTNLIKLETRDGDGKPYLTLDLTENNLTLKYSHFSLTSQVENPSSFFVEIFQFYTSTRNKVVTRLI